MSRKELRCVGVLDRVRSGELTQEQAGQMLSLCSRQIRRKLRRLACEGEAGLVHGLRGKPGNRGSKTALRKQALALIRSHYPDFGPTLARQMLHERHGLSVSVETLRRWMHGAKIRPIKPRKQVQRSRRERRACFGDLVQLDGSHHDWFEGRNPAIPKCTLMVMVDDATSTMLMRFFPSESLEAAMEMLRLWALRHGLPVELYPDRHSIYRVNSEAVERAVELGEARPKTQFGRAMDALGVRLTCAGSPQAKGRVERANQTLQDRLVKMLRLAKIDTIEAANAFLAESDFMERHVARFEVAARDPADLHRPVSEAELAEHLVVLDERVVGSDLCISHDGVLYQLRPHARQRVFPKGRVEVARQRDGSVEVRKGGHVVRSQVVNARPVRSSPKPSQTPVGTGSTPYKPAANHPWRGQRQAPVVPPSVGASPLPAGSPPGPA